ncbi:MAG: PDZ domain-containing protein [Planctomycetes bacterium]|nr:PDZ domain-containing protein [Planctomycetota bacterium]
MHLTTLASLVLGSATLGASFQPLPTVAQGQLVRVQPTAPATSADIEGWKNKLAASDLDLREQSFEALVNAARRDESLRTALEGWARDEASVELAWSARLALRELGPRHAAGQGPRARRGVFFPDAFGQDFDLDDLRREMFEDLDRSFPGFGRRGGPPIPPAPQDGSGLSMRSQSESLSLESGPDGVKCKISRSENGQTTTEEYSAKSIDELLEQHPELRGKVGGGSAHGGAQAGQSWPLDLQRELASEVRTDILGVAIVPLSAEEATALGLEPGVGLRIERVEPGSIAQQLGLQRGHVLLEMNGVSLRSRDDVSRQLQAREERGPVEVIVIDRWGQRRTRSWKPAASRQV